MAVAPRPVAPKISDVVFIVVGEMNFANQSSQWETHSPTMTVVTAFELSEQPLGQCQPERVFQNSIIINNECGIGAAEEQTVRSCAPSRPSADKSELPSEWTLPSFQDKALS